MSEDQISNQGVELSTAVRPEIEAELLNIAEVTGLDEEEVIRRLLNIALDRLDFDNRNTYTLGKVKGGEK